MANANEVKIIIEEKLTAFRAAMEKAFPMALPDEALLRGASAFANYAAMRSNPNHGSDSMLKRQD